MGVTVACGNGKVLDLSADMMETSLITACNASGTTRSIAERPGVAEPMREETAAAAVKKS